MYAEHPVIDTPPDDTIIWRYMDLPKLLALCSTSRLHLSRLDKLPDPWEGYWPRWIDPQQPGLTSDRFRPVSEFSRRCFFVNCWHENQWESAALWDQYGHSRGLAVRSTIGRLKQACNTAQVYYVGRVRYLDYSQPTEKVSLRNSFIPAFLKRKSFEHEREVRVLVDELPPEDDAGAIKLSAAQEYQELPVALKELIESVWISPECPQWHVDPIKQLLQKFDLQVPVERSTLYDATIR